MNLFLTSSLAIWCCVETALGDGPAATVGLASPLNQYYTGRNLLAPGYSPYYNPASATAPILSYSNNHGIDGSYSYSFTTGDGKQAKEIGFLKDAYIDKYGQPQGTQVKEGSYGYTSPEGIPIQLNYVADENGFRHSGVHIPADGKGVVPSSLFSSLNGAYDPRYSSRAYDPGYSSNDPYSTYRNRFGQLGQYNPLAPIDARYPFDPRHNINNRWTAPTAIGKDKKV